MAASSIERRGSLSVSSAATHRPQHLLAESHSLQPGPDTRRKHRKYRYRGQGYHKNERENARRVEAKRFLSGITLDSHLRPPIETADKENVSKQQMGGSAASIVEELVKSNPDLPNRDDLEALYELYSHHHSPVKMALSRSNEVFDSSPFASTPVSRSVSIADSSAVPILSHEVKRTSLQHMSKSMGSSTEGTLHFFTNVKKFPGTPLDSRYVFVSSGSPFLAFSVMAYKKDEVTFNTERPQRQRTRVNSTSIHHLELDVELDSNEEVSLGHLFRPLRLARTEEDSEAFGLPVLLSGHASSPQQVFHLTASYSQVLEQPLPSASGTTFPWARFRDHHDAKEVIVYYHPLCMDNYQYFVGPNISTLSVPGYRVSVIQYAKAPELKRGINDQFKETFPYLKITLSKLRSIKKEMLNIAKEAEIDLAAVAHAYVYYEKLVLMGKVDKSNRKLVAGVCLLLAVKFFMDAKKQVIKDLLEEISDTFRVSCEDVVACELPVLAALHFSLLTPIYQTLTHYEHLRDR